MAEISILENFRLQRDYPIWAYQATLHKKSYADQSLRKSRSVAQSQPMVQLIYDELLADMRHHVENHSCWAVTRYTTSRRGGKYCNSSFAVQQCGDSSCLMLKTSAGLERIIMSRRPTPALMFSPFMFSLSYPCRWFISTRDNSISLNSRHRATYIFRWKLLI